MHESPQVGKPYVFFDLGETIVNLRDTVGVIASTLATSYPSIAGRATDCAKSWFVGLASEVPRDPTAKFETQYDVGRRILLRVLQENGVSVDETETGRLLRAAWNRWQERARLCEGVTREWLREVRRLSAGIGAITDGDEADVRRLLDKMSLTGHFDSITTSESVKAYKPNPAIYLAALAALVAAPRNSLFVSDSVLDVAGALAVGMSAVWFHQKSADDEAGLPLGAVRISKPTELNRILARFAETAALRSDPGNPGKRLN